jgi:hypothetical protein
MEFIDTLVVLREAYRSGKFQEESVQGERKIVLGDWDALERRTASEMMRPYTREELKQLQHNFCPNCGEFNNHYPEPCSFCVAEFEADEARRVAANRARETRCVECGVVSATYVCPSCYGK